MLGCERVESVPRPNNAAVSSSVMNESLIYSHRDDCTLSARLASGDRQALELLLDRNRDRLKRMLLVRLTPDLAARMDASDIIQEAFLQAAINADNYEHHPDRSFYLWIRKIAENKLLEAHRRHVGAAKRDLHRERHLHDSPGSISSASLAGLFLASSGSGPLSKVMRAEARQMIQRALSEMGDVDREVLVLRHFEQLSLSEVGDVLELSKSGAAKRYRAAVERLRSVIEQFPGFL